MRRFNLSIKGKADLVKPMCLLHNLFPLRKNLKQNKMDDA